MALKEMNIFNKNKAQQKEEQEYSFIKDYKGKYPCVCRFLKEILQVDCEPSFDEFENLADRYFKNRNIAIELDEENEKLNKENEKLSELLKQKESEINRYKEELQTATKKQKTESNSGLTDNEKSTYENKIKTLQNEINSYKAYIKNTNQRDALKAFKKGEGGRKAIVIDWAKYDILRANGATQQQTADIMKIGVSTLRKKLKEREVKN